MLAVLYALQHCGSTIHIATDYLPAVTGFHRGKQWCVSSRSKFADVWRQIWERIDDIGNDNVCISKFQVTFPGKMSPQARCLGKTRSVMTALTRGQKVMRVLAPSMMTLLKLRISKAAYARLPDG
jgi:hypothetical protein